MSSATRDVPIDQLRALPLRKRLQIVDALLDSIERERRPAPSSAEFDGELDRRDDEDVAEPSATIRWEEVTEIHTVVTLLCRPPRHRLAG